MAASSTESEQRGLGEQEAGAGAGVGTQDAGAVADGHAQRGRAERVAALLAEGDQNTSADEIQSLREQRRKLNVRKREVTEQLCNESRKRARMLQRGSQLTNDDLLEVLQIRQSRAAAAKAKARAGPDP